jgi:nitroreductase
MIEPAFPPPAPEPLALSAEELLTTTRAVRKRLDFDRPVPREALERCVALALQAPSGSNRWALQFVFVTEPARRQALAEIYRGAYAHYQASPGYIGKVDKHDGTRNAQQQRTAGSADFLAENLHRAPVIAVACTYGRFAADAGAGHAAGLFGSAAPGIWSFMLAARLYGLGTAWTTMNFARREDTEATARLLEIPQDKVTMVSVFPVAYTLGTEFRPALRPEPHEVTHWETW